MSEYMDEIALAALGSPDSDDIPLRNALAKFIAEDMEEGGIIISNIINEDSENYKKYAHKRLDISYLSIVIFIVTLLFSFLFAEKMVNLSNILYGISLLSLFGIFIPPILIQYFQYGRTTPEVPLDLPYPADKCIDAFLAILQKEFGSKAYYFSPWKRKRKVLERRQFFGKLRYQLFSEHSKIRKLVTRYPTAFPLPSDIFLRRSDLEKMIEDGKPKRKGGPGRTPSPRYADGIIALLGDQKLLRIDTRDAESAIKQIRKILMDWFKANKDDTEWEPKTNQIETYVEKIYARLKNLAAHS